MALSVETLTQRVSKLINDVGMSQQLHELSRASLRHYMVDSPLDIGFLSRRKRHDAFYDMMDDVERIRELHNLRDEEAGILLLRLVLNDKRCFKALSVFDEEWNNEEGRTLPSPRSGIWMQDVFPWMRHVGYDPFLEGDTPEDNPLARLRARAEEREREGAALAEESFRTVLLQGQYVQQSKVDAYLNEKYEYDPTSRSTGFLKRMLRYRQEGEVITFEVVSNGRDDILYVHRNHAEEVAATLQNNQRQHDEKQKRTPRI